MNYNLGEVIGWPQLVATVASVYQSLPPGERSTVVILTANYGEAGVIDRYGPRYGPPGAFSGHNAYWFWGPPQGPPGTTIAVGFEDPGYLRLRFSNVTLAARIFNGFGVANDEPRPRAFLQEFVDVSAGQRVEAVPEGAIFGKLAAQPDSLR